MRVNIQESTLKTLVCTKLSHGYSLPVTAPNETTQTLCPIEGGHTNDENEAIWP